MSSYKVLSQEKVAGLLSKVTRESQVTVQFTQSRKGVNCLRQLLRMHRESNSVIFSYSAARDAHECSIYTAFVASSKVPEYPVTFYVRPTAVSNQLKPILDQLGRRVFVASTMLEFS